jgi:deoxyribose-phosphate aldolase
MYRLESRLLEIRLAIEDGADEIDTVINRPAALDSHWIGWHNFINGVVVNLKFVSNSQKSTLNYDKCATHAVNTCT